MIGNKTSFQNTVVRKLGVTVSRKRYTTIEDGMGGTISQTSASEDKTVIFGNITAKDLRINEMGLAVVGNMKIYFDADQDIIEGDVLIDSNSIEWRIEKITSEYDGVYSIGVVRNISLKGSE